MGSRSYPIILLSRSITSGLDLPEGMSKEFQRHAYQLLKDDKVTLLHYVGNEKAAVNFCHGNKKTDTCNYNRTAPSTISRLKHSVVSETPSRIYKREIDTPTETSIDFQKVALPRNMKQISNLKTYTCSILCCVFSTEPFLYHGYVQSLQRKFKD